MSRLPRLVCDYSLRLSGYSFGVMIYRALMYSAGAIQSAFSCRQVAGALKGGSWTKAPCDCRAQQ